MSTLKDIENEFIRTGVFNISGFFKITREMNNKKVEFDLIPSTELEKHEVEYEKEKEVFDKAWVDSVLK